MAQIHTPPAKASMVQTLWQKLHSACTERWFRIQTTGRADALTEEGVHYTPLPYMMIGRMIHELKLSTRDVFVDVGCGKGRVLCCVARQKISRAIGVELNRELLDIAARNVTRLRGKLSTVDLEHVSAESYSYRDATVVYLYNPFNERLTTLVMRAVRSSLKENPRRIRVVYANPVHEKAVLADNWLSRYAHWPASDFPGFGYSVSFLQNSD